MKIYTKTGDHGETGLFGGPRVSKDTPRIEAYGTVDELNSVLGVVRAQAIESDIDALLRQIQNELFDLGAQLATPDPAAHHTSLIGPPQIVALEAAIDRFEARLDPLKQFILPGGTPAAAQLHLARTVCRRAERRLVTLVHQSAERIADDLVIYLNRRRLSRRALAKAAVLVAVPQTFCLCPRGQDRTKPCGIRAARSRAPGHNLLDDAPVSAIRPAARVTHGLQSRPVRRAKTSAGGGPVWKAQKILAGYFTDSPAVATLVCLIALKFVVWGVPISSAISASWIGWRAI